MIFNIFNLILQVAEQVYYLTKSYNNLNTLHISQHQGGMFKPTNDAIIEAFI